jgi:hypothetical protein
VLEKGKPLLWVAQQLQEAHAGKASQASLPRDR